MDKINFDFLNVIFIFITGILAGFKYFDNKINTKADKQELEKTIKIIYRILENVEKIIDEKLYEKKSNEKYHSKNLDEP